MRVENENVYDDNGMFKFSEYECGIKHGMSKKEKIELVEEREDYVYNRDEEESLRECGII